MSFNRLGALFRQDLAHPRSILRVNPYVRAGGLSSDTLKWVSDRSTRHNPVSLGSPVIPQAFFNTTFNDLLTPHVGWEDTAAGARALGGVTLYPGGTNVSANNGPRIAAVWCWKILYTLRGE